MFLVIISCDFRGTNRNFEGTAKSVIFEEQIVNFRGTVSFAEQSVPRKSQHPKLHYTGLFLGTNFEKGPTYNGV